MTLSGSDVQDQVDRISSEIRKLLDQGYLGEKRPTVGDIRARVDDIAKDVAERFKLLEFDVQRDLDVRAAVDKDDPTVVHLTIEPKTKLGEVVVTCMKYGQMQPPSFILQTITLAHDEHSFGNDGTCAVCGHHRDPPRY